MGMRAQSPTVVISSVFAADQGYVPEHVTDVHISLWLLYVVLVRRVRHRAPVLHVHRDGPMHRISKGLSHHKVKDISLLHIDDRKPWHTAWQRRPSILPVRPKVAKAERVLLHPLQLRRPQRPSSDGAGGGKGRRGPEAAVVDVDEPEAAMAHGHGPVLFWHTTAVTEVITGFNPGKPDEAKLRVVGCDVAEQDPLVVVRPAHEPSEREHGVSFPAQRVEADAELGGHVEPGEVPLPGGRRVPQELSHDDFFARAGAGAWQKIRHEEIILCAAAGDARLMAHAQPVAEGGETLKPRPLGVDLADEQVLRGLTRGSAFGVID